MENVVLMMDIYFMKCNFVIQKIEHYLYIRKIKIILIHHRLVINTKRDSMMRHMLISRNTLLFWTIHEISIDDL